MASAATAHGERRFGAAYSVRILVTLGVLGLIVGLWAGQQDRRTTSHPELIWISVGLVAAVVAVWIVLGKSVLTVGNFGVGCGSVLGQRELGWSRSVASRV